MNTIQSLLNRIIDSGNDYSEYFYINDGYYTLEEAFTTHTDRMLDYTSSSEGRDIPKSIVDNYLSDSKPEINKAITTLDITKLNLMRNLLETITDFEITLVKIKLTIEDFVPRWPNSFEGIQYMRIGEVEVGSIPVKITSIDTQYFVLLKYCKEYIQVYKLRDNSLVAKFKGVNKFHYDTYVLEYVKSRLILPDYYANILDIEIKKPFKNTISNRESFEAAVKEAGLYYMMEYTDGKDTVFRFSTISLKYYMQISASTIMSNTTFHAKGIKYYPDCFLAASIMDRINKYLSKSVPRRPKANPSILSLRQHEPKLFVGNVARVIHELPIPISRSDVDYYTSIGRSIMQYPKNGKYYMSREGLYIGLKYNTLKSRDEYPEIPTCYKTDESKRVGSCTYNYVNNVKNGQYTWIIPKLNIVTMVNRPQREGSLKPILYPVSDLFEYGSYAMSVGAYSDTFIRCICYAAKRPVNSDELKRDIAYPINPMSLSYSNAQLIEKYLNANIFVFQITVTDGETKCSPCKEFSSIPLVMFNKYNRGIALIKFSHIGNTYYDIVVNGEDPYITGDRFDKILQLFGDQVYTRFYVPSYINEESKKEIKRVIDCTYNHEDYTNNGNILDAYVATRDKYYHCSHSFSINNTTTSLRNLSNNDTKVVISDNMLQLYDCDDIKLLDSILPDKESFEDNVLKIRVERVL